MRKTEYIESNEDSLTELKGAFMGGGFSYKSDNQKKGRVIV
jgi:hypothetical protein